MIKSTFLVANIFLATFVYSQEVQTEKLNQFFDALGTHNKAMGSFAIYKDGKVAYQKHMGIIKAQPQKDADSQSQYRIGSISKIFTAVLTMKAVEEKKLGLSTLLSEYFPQIKNANKITIEQLLNHTSGIKNFTSDINFFTYYDKPITQSRHLEIINAGGSEFEPGTRFSYSNSNYILLAYILEHVYKTNYGDLLAKKITNPLSLQNTAIFVSSKDGDNVAQSFSFAGTYTSSKETHPSIAIGGGNIMSTTEDLLKFIVALEEGKIISKKSVEKMKNYNTNYGLGIVQVPYDKMEGYGHAGSIDNFNSFLYYFPKEKTAVAGLLNHIEVDPNDVAIEMLNGAFNKEVKIPLYTKVTLTESQLSPMVGTYAAEGFPLKITILIKDGQLMGQATGQGAFLLTPTSEKTFTFDAAKIEVEFNTVENTMNFQQGNFKKIFIKEK